MATVTKANLATYLAGLTPSATPYPIEITETVVSDWRGSGTSGTVGNIINTNTPSGVYLDLGLTIIPSSVTDMTYTFHYCTALTTAPVIPNSVTNMFYTFYYCTALTTAPIIPSSVTDMNGTFRNCTALHTIQNFLVDVDICNMTNAFQDCPALANIYVTTLSESSWHLLHTNTGATGTDYTIYNPDGTVAGSGTVAGTSQVLSLYGKSDELVISANITPTLAVETATSQVQWHKSGLPYDDELMIFNAKNPDTVISNFITVNRAGEEFLGKSKDSYPIPTDAVLQYSFDEIKQLPDNPAGTVYKRDNDWTTVDGWESGHAPSITLSIENQSLKVVYDGTRRDIGLSFQKTGLTYNGKFIVGRIKSTVPILSVHYYTGTKIKPLKLNKKTEYEAIFYGYMQGDFALLVLYMNYDQLTAKTCWIESLYIGDGSYLDPVIDNSYSEAHAENHGVIPVDGVCGKAGYFNNSYMIAPRPALANEITIYFWAKFESIPSVGMTIIQSRAGASATGLNAYVTSVGYALNWGGVSTQFSSHTIPINTWHHVVMKSNQTTKQLKINGSLVASATGTYTNHTNFSTNIIVGKSAVPDGSPLTGALDGLKIVPRYTTDDEDIGEYKARANLPKFYTYERYLIENL